MNLHHSAETLECMIANLPYQRHVLERIGCDQITPFVLALAEWPGRPPETGMDGKALSPGDRQLFIALHLAACKLLRVQPHAPDLRFQRDRLAADRDDRFSESDESNHLSPQPLCERAIAKRTIVMERLIGVRQSKHVGEYKRPTALERNPCLPQATDPTHWRRRCRH
jgi:hypothetical protein